MVVLLLAVVPLLLVLVAAYSMHFLLTRSRGGVDAAHAFFKRYVEIKIKLLCKKCVAHQISPG